MNKLTLKGRLISIVIVYLLIGGCTFQQNQNNQPVSIEADLSILSPHGKIILTAYQGGAIEVQLIKECTSRLEQCDEENRLPSFSLSETAKIIRAEIQEKPNEWHFINGELKAIVNKSNFDITFYRGGQRLTTQRMAFSSKVDVGFEFMVDESEVLMGGGERILGMNRRGTRVPLYNKAHYGYTTHSEQMYFSIPAFVSDKKYLVLYDNSAKGMMDFAKKNKETVSFESVGGRSSYLVFSGASFPQLIERYVTVTGKQPLPARWIFGNHASRFGYRSQQEVESIVEQYREKDFPVDSIIIDLYWFGKDIKGHLGNLDWDKSAFPEPIKMIKNLNEKGVKTIVITEPFVLSSSNRWQDALKHSVCATDQTGKAKRFDFYFGNTCLIDVFKSTSQKWFWDKYQTLFEQGIAGTWGDLGEPEVHPDDSYHIFNGVTKLNKKVLGQDIHNVYGHQWAKMVFENQRQLQPNERPMIMMRSGFAGSQRYGMIPWTGDVSRSWDGLKPQVELSLQMGLLGMGYTHSDLGGFAGGEHFDKELYIRWLQYGVFQPVFRPHGQEHIAPEPIFHDKETQTIIRRFIKLRYQLLPYLYTMAFQNASTGMPLMRPLFFSDEKNKGLFDRKDSYFWGDSFFVHPVTSGGLSSIDIQPPKGVWFDFWSDQKMIGGQTITYSLQLDTLPVLVKAGSFIPMVEAVNSTVNYSSKHLNLHYYMDKSVSLSDGFLIEDDGQTFGTIERKWYEKLLFKGEYKNGTLSIDLSRDANEWEGAVKKRKVRLIIHNWDRADYRLALVKKKRSQVDEKNVVTEFNEKKKILSVEFDWDHSNQTIVIR